MQLVKHGLERHLRKGPVERIPFPCLTQTTSPFQQLGQFLLLLGKKIDAAQNQQVWVSAKAICSSTALLFVQDRLQPHVGSDHKAKEPTPHLDSFSTKLLESLLQVNKRLLRLSAGMADPLTKLKKLNGELIDMQAAATAVAPTKPPACIYNRF